MSTCAISSNVIIFRLFFYWGLLNLDFYLDLGPDYKEETNSDCNVTSYLKCWWSLFNLCTCNWIIKIFNSCLMKKKIHNISTVILKCGRRWFYVVCPSSTVIPCAWFFSDSDSDDDEHMESSTWIGQQLILTSFEYVIWAQGRVQKGGLGWHRPPLKS